MLNPLILVRLQYLVNRCEYLTALLTDIDLGPGLEVGSMLGATRERSIGACR